MEKNMYGFSERLKNLRNKMGITQSELAKKLSLTRASVNAWEMGLSSPSIPFVVELSKIFHVSTDYILGLENEAILNTKGLTEKEVAVLINTIECFKINKNMETKNNTDI